MVTEATEDSVAIMLINQAKGIVDWKCAGRMLSPHQAMNLRQHFMACMNNYSCRIKDTLIKVSTNRNAKFALLQIKHLLFFNYPASSSFLHFIVPDISSSTVNFVNNFCFISSVILFCFLSVK